LCRSIWGLSTTTCIHTRPHSIYHQKLFINAYNSKHVVAMHKVVVVSSYCLVFQNNEFTYDLLFDLVENTKNMYVLFALHKCTLTIATFGIWMSKGAFNIFALINFLSVDWQLKHVMIRLFEVTFKSLI
jgi:hypothetical protein